jgi:hypothetical protein
MATKQKTGKASAKKSVDAKKTKAKAKVIPPVEPAATQPPVPPTPPVVNEDLFHVSIQMNEEVFESETEDLREAILSLNPPTIKTKVKFKVTWHGKEVNKLMFVPQARRVFFNRMSAEFFAVNIIKQLKAL